MNEPFRCCRFSWPPVAWWNSAVSCSLDSLAEGLFDELAGIPAG